jgi:uncharacterized membrane protein YraQ (UPF0718 family)
VSAVQSKADSWIETIINVGIGFIVSLAVQILLVAPLLGLRTNTGENVVLVLIFTVTSIARQYTLRRLFNGRSVWATLKERFS